MTLGNPICYNYKGQDYQLVRFQKEHENEYVIYEVENGVENGKAQLFQDGMLKAAWSMKNGIYTGTYTLFQEGTVLKQTTWEEIKSSNSKIRWIVNKKKKRVMEIENRETGNLLYRGEFDTEMECSGYGIQYDETSGRAKQSGYFSNGKLIHLHQVFTYNDFLDKKDAMSSEKDRSEDHANSFESSQFHSTTNSTPEQSKQIQMIEYGGEFNENNIQMWKRRPVFIGECKYNEDECVFKRHGKGKEIDEWSGICKYEGRWENGEAIEEKGMVLMSGWYTSDESNCITSSRVSVLALQNVKEQIQLYEELCPGLVIHNNLEQLVTAAEMYNDWTITTLVLKEYSQLRQIVFGNHSFVNVRSVSISEMTLLESIEFGEACFRDDEIRERIDGELRIINCPKLCLLHLKDNACNDYCTIELDKLDSLSSIHFGARCFYYCYDLVLAGISFLSDRYTD